MFGLKTFLDEKISNRNFPSKPTPYLKRKIQLLRLHYNLYNQRRSAGLSDLLSLINREAALVWKKLLPYNPNNLGNWSFKPEASSQVTSRIEKEVIAKMISLYRGEKSSFEGYFTSGGTESNIFSTWLGIKSLEKKGIKREKMIILKSSLTHYSLDKAADITDLKTYTVALDEKSWGINPINMINTIEMLVAKGYKGFLIPLTLGYTLTGTVDPIDEICLAVDKLRKKRKVEFFLWIDAAFNGLIEPFLNKEFIPFRNTNIQTFNTDFHKYGFVPIPAGLILYRKELRNLIERPIDYLKQKDSTLLGSRSGIAPVSCWFVINSLGKEGFKKSILEMQKKMRHFVKEYKTNKDLKFVVFPRSLNCAIIAKKMNSDILNFAKSYGLDFRKTEVMFVNRKEKYLISKLFFFR